ncbi:MAG: EAL domain-containing protein [Eubacterium sp.]|nr:EAL domain-containing protein [Eubacterium sp.]
MGEQEDRIISAGEKVEEMLQRLKLREKTVSVRDGDKTKMSEPELVGCFDDAINFGHIFAVYQPQINHSTGRMVGAEALMRWKHPVYGVQLPGDFIPVLEKNNLIYKADLYIFETVCRFQRKCLDQGFSIIPVSVNMSRFDIYNTNYVEEIESIRKKYDIPVRFLRLEITESSAIGGLELITKVLKQLHDCGYTVEMDDFGSGYSSLNILKDLPVDVIKLDMKFLSGDIGGRGGTILSSIVQMTKWLNTPVIAEGVETVEQADYMKSTGCNYIQGYLYYKPLPEEEFLEKLQQLDHEPLTPAMNLINTLDAGKFWDPNSLETLIFNNFVGGAAIFTYNKDTHERKILRVNRKYVKELGMNMNEHDIIGKSSYSSFDEENEEKFVRLMERAIESRDEEVGETWRTVYSDCCGEDRICIRSYVRVIGEANNEYLIYAMVQNVTAEKKHELQAVQDELRYKAAFEHANVYAWEYAIATKEMRPCYRCMRDLGLPPVIKNYPEPVIESGLFPPDYADMYRDWMKQLEEGVESLDAVIPLTVGRVPFHVRYTLEKDENGKPLKAYGSATLVVDAPEKEE